jgi:DNA-binding MltR family transcriptional regulator
MEQFDFHAYWRNLNFDERKQFANDAGSTQAYIHHLSLRNKIPRQSLMDSLFAALKQRQVIDDKGALLSFFYTR